MATLRRRPEEGEARARNGRWRGKLLRCRVTPAHQSMGLSPTPSALHPSHANLARRRAHVQVRRPAPSTCACRSHTAAPSPGSASRRPISRPVSRPGSLFLLSPDRGQAVRRTPQAQPYDGRMGDSSTAATPPTDCPHPRLAALTPPREPRHRGHAHRTARPPARASSPRCHPPTSPAVGSARMHRGCRPNTQQPERPAAVTSPPGTRPPGPRPGQDQGQDQQ
ncbi:hypothetical protein T440DRAFT_231441 [Plenodomus tracheiphilus IPT5]|uniref:Uncharacterized protein n=1 Tax=Plenodomus tracheiphilus IPT5 TaxID=1408161 RepID=A0A6A7AU31_9PLEO|nr:hypothetical protein T440DRAFT_231441 [Plenodomus tracheiphilus IPT5]